MHSLAHYLTATIIISTPIVCYQNGSGDIDINEVRAGILIKLNGGDACTMKSINSTSACMH